MGQGARGGAPRRVGATGRRRSRRGGDFGRVADRRGLRLGGGACAHADDREGDGGALRARRGGARRRERGHVRAPRAGVRLAAGPRPDAHPELRRGAGRPRRVPARQERAVAPPLRGRPSGARRGRQDPPVDRALRARGVRARDAARDVRPRGPHVGLGLEQPHGGRSRPARVGGVDGRAQRARHVGDSRLLRSPPTNRPPGLSPPCCATAPGPTGSIASPTTRGCSSCSSATRARRRGAPASPSGPRRASLSWLVSSKAGACVARRCPARGGLLPGRRARRSRRAACRGRERSPSRATRAR